MKYLALSLVVLIISLVFYAPILAALTYAFYFIGIVALIGMVFACAVAWEKWGILRAERKRREIGLELDGHGMLHLINYLTNHTQNLTINTNAYRNGHYETPSPFEVSAYNAVMSKGKQLAEIPPSLQLESGELQKDLFTLIDEYPHTDIWNSTGAGKTSLCRSIGLRRKSAGHQVVVLDSSEHPARWSGLERVANLPAQVETIARLFAIHERNGQALADGRAIESDFQQITVISEEWTDIIRALDRQDNDIARRFIDEMARKARKTGIHCVFTTQTNLAADLGLDGRYRVIRNFLQLEMTNHPERGFICNAVIGGFKLGEWQVPAPPPLPPMLSQGYVAPTLGSVPDPEIIQPSLHEQKIMNLYDADNSFNEIARQVFGKAGGNQTKEIKTILSKYGYM